MVTDTIPFEAVLGSTTTDKRVEVLRSIHQAGSISEAARVNGISYKAAWQAVESLGNLAEVPLIEKAVGGSGGGGTRLTRHGLAVLRAADILSAARQAALAKIRGADGDSPASLQGVVGMGLRTSMRNQFPCVVRDLVKSQGAVRVRLELPDGQTLIARITSESVQLLGLCKGLPVLALCKAAAVTVAPVIVAIGGVNLLSGRVTRRIGPKADRQWSLSLSPSLQIVGFVGSDVQLAARQSAMAAIDESAVVIGLPG